MYHVYRSTTFEKELKKLTKPEQERIFKIEKKISENPFAGKPLKYDFLREKKLNGKRVYYYTYKDFLIILMAAISTKKNQGPTIEELIKLKDYFYEIAKNL